MAILKALSVSEGHGHANLVGIIKYILKEEKTEKRLVYGHCVDVPTAYKQMIETKKLWNKENGIEYYHFIQSFPPNEKITPEQALVQAKKFLEATDKFKGYEIVVAVHKDKEHIHSHFIINSVSFANGKKFQISNKDLRSLKQLQNKINIRDGYLPAPEKYKGKDNQKRTEKVVNNKNTYQLLDKAENGEKDSYILNCALALLKVKTQATSRDEFIEMMKEKGFGTEWRDTRKHITFSDLKRKEQGEKKYKIRLKTLADYYPEFSDINTKELLENELNKNSARIGRELARIRDTNRAIITERAKLSDREIETNHTRSKQQFSKVTNSLRQENIRSRTSSAYEYSAPKKFRGRSR